MTVAGVAWIACDEALTPADRDIAVESPKRWQRPELEPWTPRFARGDWPGIDPDRRVPLAQEP